VEFAKSKLNIVARKIVAGDGLVGLEEVDGYLPVTPSKMRINCSPGLIGRAGS
jgi:hypothetical protein